MKIDGLEQIKSPKELLNSLKNDFAGRLSEIREQIDAINYELPGIAESVEKSQVESRLIMLRRESMRLSGEIKSCDAALQLVALDEYGFCITCGYDIDKERLQSRPQSLKCVACQELEERRAREYAR